VVSVVGFVWSLVMSVGAIIVGWVTGSIATVGSGFSDLFDVASGVTAILGFKTANGKKSPMHPHGHGRMEYIAGLVVSIIIIFASIVLVYLAGVRIFHPVKIDSSVVAILVILSSMIVNGGLGIYYYVENRKLKSPLVSAALRKSVGDVLITCAALFSLVFAPFTDLPVDGMSGCVVGLLILTMGVDSFVKNTQLLIGYRPDNTLRHKVRVTILAAESFTRIDKMTFHDYGPTMREAVVRVRLKRETTKEDVERDIKMVQKILKMDFGVIATIYWAPR